MNHKIVFFVMHFYGRTKGLYVKVILCHYDLILVTKKNGNKK